MLKLEVEKFPQITVVHCSGRIVQGDESEELLRAVRSQNSRQIQIDLGRVSAIDAGGLGVLVALERWARSTDRTIRLINATRPVKKVLDATGLSTVLQIGPAVRNCGEAA